MIVASGARTWARLDFKHGGHLMLIEITSSPGSRGELELVPWR